MAVDMGGIGWLYEASSTTQRGADCSDPLADHNGVRQCSDMYRATHATLASFRMDQSRLVEAREALERFIVPGVKQNQGVVDGYWFNDPTADDQTFAFVSFNSFEAAEAFSVSVRANEAGQQSFGIQLLRLDIVDITATT